MKWHRRDRTRGTFGGMAVCLHKNLSVMPLDVTLPDRLEMTFFMILGKHLGSMPFCVRYRPQWQGIEPIVFLQIHPDRLLQQHSCYYVVIVGDMNHHLVARPFEKLLTVFGLTNHVDFPTHKLGSSLDPVISVLPDSVVICRPLGTLWSSDHLAVLNVI